MIVLLECYPWQDESVVYLAKTWILRQRWLEWCCRCMVCARIEWRRLSHRHTRNLECAMWYTIYYMEDEKECKCQFMQHTQIHRNKYKWRECSADALNKKTLVMEIKVSLSRRKTYLSFAISALYKASARNMVLLVPPATNLANKIQ